MKEKDNEQVDKLKMATENDCEAVIDQRHKSLQEQNSYIVEFDGTTDPSDPIAWSKTCKWCTVSLLSSMMLVV